MRIDYILLVHVTKWIRARRQEAEKRIYYLRDDDSDSTYLLVNRAA